MQWRERKNIGKNKELVICEVTTLTLFIADNFVLLKQYGDPQKNKEKKKEEKKNSLNNIDR